MVSSRKLSTFFSWLIFDDSPHRVVLVYPMVTWTVKNKSVVGGLNHLEKYEFVNGKDYPIYEMENKSHVPNHQPDQNFP